VISRPANIAAIGEVLWDLFPDGEHFGGAPANFACMAAQLARDTMSITVASAVGKDELGERAIEALRTRGVDTSCVSQVDWPTGQVNVQLDLSGQPTYQIAQDSAWDNIGWSNNLEELAATCDAVCFGTLAQRSTTSRTSINYFLSATPRNCLRILDVNLREPFWNEHILLHSMKQANVVKLNDSEITIIADVLGWDAPDQVLVKQLLERFELDILAVTRGSKGAMLAAATGERSEFQGRQISVVDTVGAGDAYTAVLAIGLLRGLPLATINALAIRVAGYVCAQSGAAPKIPTGLCNELSDLG
jgi:fructokinase